MISSPVNPPAVTTSVRTGLPWVIVPVLSRMTVWSFCAVCSASPPRMRIPFSAPSPTPVVSDIGVAIPSAQGHAMMRVVTATFRAYTARGSGPKVYQTMKPRIARIATDGVRQARCRLDRHRSDEAFNTNGQPALKAAGSSFGAFVRASVFLLCFFSAVFYGADSIARLRDGHFRLYFEWERRIPFYPVAYLAYYSVALLPLLIPAFVRDEGDIRLWKRRMSLAIAIAGVAFVLFPAEIGYVPVTTEDWLVVRRLTPILTGRYNLAPSLHVALMIIIMHALWPHLHRRGRGLMLAWGVVLPLSTLFTHQHHVLDVATGLWLGFLVCFRFGVR